MSAAQRALDAWNALDSKDGLGAALHVGQMLADALTAEVRPRGTVTDAEVERAADAICMAAEGVTLTEVRMSMRDQYRSEARAALNAARLS